MSKGVGRYRSNRFGVREVIGKVLENPQGGISCEDGNPKKALCEVLRNQVGQGVAVENVKRGCVEMRRGKAPRHVFQAPFTILSGLAPE